MAASESALPARVPPIPPVSMISRLVFDVIALAIASVIPKVPVGNPPAIALPIVKISGLSPSAAVMPPAETEMVCVSSIIQTTSYFLASSPTATR